MRYLINLGVLALVWCIALGLNRLLKCIIDKNIINLQKRKKVLVLKYLRRKKNNGSSE